MGKSKGRKVYHPNIGTLVESLVSECRSPAHLLELYYWSTEPELLPIIRGFAALPSGTRVQLEAFLHATDPETVGAAIETDGDIRLTRTARAPLPKRRRIGHAMPEPLQSQLLEHPRDLLQTRWCCRSIG